MKEINKVAHPIFIFSVLLLILNDWYFKAEFHNELTGKISDFAGLFAFPFFLGILFPNNRKLVHYLTGILFILWNSEFSQPLINYVNSVGLPVMRTIDITDNIALISIVVSYKCLDLPLISQPNPLFRSALITISCLAFMATSLPPQENRKYVNINKEYAFEISKRELVSRLNMVQIKEVRKLNKIYGRIDFDSQTNAFHYNGRTDTLALLLDYTNITDQDTIEFRTSYAEIFITGNETNSTLKLLSVYKFVVIQDEKDYREKTIKQFEKKIIREIRKR